MTPLQYPSSFPNTSERMFLKLLLCPDADFRTRWNEWRTTVVFEDIDYATLRLLPLLFLRLRSFHITDDSTGRIRGAYRLAWFKNQRILAASEHIISRCAEHGIEVLLLKGIPLLRSVYKDTGARFLGDGDLLIHPKDAPIVLAIMQENNWEYTEEDYRHITTALPNFATEILKGAAFRNNQSVEIDIHWRVFDRDRTFTFPTHAQSRRDFQDAREASFWERSVPAELGKSSCRMLCPEDLLLHVIVHGSAANRHRTLRWVVDAVYILRTHQIDWTDFIARSQLFDCIPAVQYAISYIAHYYPNEISFDIASRIAAIPTKESARKSYFQRATKRNNYARWGNLPILWSAYHAIASPYTFLDFLRIAWGLKKISDIPVFVLKKYLLRIRTIART